MSYLIRVDAQLQEQRCSDYRVDIDLKSNFVARWADVLALRMVEVEVEGLA